jgi:hypothetical protein
MIWSANYVLDAIAHAMEIEFERSPQLASEQRVDA